MVCEEVQRFGNYYINLTSNTSAMMAAAMGDEADVPVCEEVQRLCRSVVTTLRSPSLG